MSDAVAGYFAADAANAQEMAALGYPRTWGAPIIPAFDVVSDMFRSLRGSTLDMYRHPDAAAGHDRPGAAGSGRPGQDGHAGHRQPAGLHPHAPRRRRLHERRAVREVLLADVQGPRAGASSRPAACPTRSSRATTRRASSTWPSSRPARWPATSTRSTAGSSRRSSATACASGATSPVSLLCTGTPQQVKDDVKELIDLFGDRGALMLDSGLGVPDEARPENLQAHARGGRRVRRVLKGPKG